MNPLSLEKSKKFKAVMPKVTVRQAVMDTVGKFGRRHFTRQHVFAAVAQVKNLRPRRVDSYDEEDSLQQTVRGEICRLSREGAITLTGKKRYGKNLYKVVR